MYKLLPIFYLLSQVLRFGQANKNTWTWTNWIECDDKNQCDVETKKFCEGDATGRLCGDPPYSQSLYYRSLFGCPPIPTNCPSWTTVQQTTCESNGKLRHYATYNFHKNRFFEKPYQGLLGWAITTG